MKTLGVIGGLGPMATAYFLQLITEMTRASVDQEHIHVLIDSNPATPDRTKYILGLSDENPYPYLISSGQKLKAAGADVLCMTCNTAQYFRTDLEKELGVNIIGLITETSGYLAARGIKKVGLMATDGSIKTRVYQDTFAAHGIETIVPDAKNQAGVMSIIYDNIKAGIPADMTLFDEISAQLFNDGAEVIVLGCTELSVIKRDFSLRPGYIDSMQVMAAKAIEICGGALDDAYTDLITK